jgi:hypothetical protein
MLGGPSLLLFAGGVSLFINSYVDTLARAVAIDASRYAALADQNYISAKGYLEQKISDHLSHVSVKSSLSLGETALVEISYQPPANLFNLANGPVSIRAVTPLEAKQ